MVHALTGERPLATLPRKLVLLSVFTLVAFSRIVVVLASTQTNSLGRGDTVRNKKVSAILAGVVRDQGGRELMTRTDSTVRGIPVQNKKVGSMLAVAPGVVHGQTKRHHPTNTIITASHNSKSDEERGFSTMGMFKSIGTFVEEIPLRLHPNKVALVEKVLSGSTIKSYSSSLLDGVEFHKAFTKITRLYSPRKDATRAIFDGLLSVYGQNGALEMKIISDLTECLVRYKKHGLRPVKPDTRGINKWEKKILRKNYKDAIELNWKRSNILELAPYIFNYWREKESSDFVYNLLCVDFKSETIFDDSRFLVWIDFLASDEDGLTSHSYDLVLDKMLKALNYDDSEIEKRLLAGNADIDPDTVAAHVMGALFKYRDSRMEKPVALHEKLEPYFDDDNFLDKPIRAPYIFDHWREKKSPDFVYNLLRVDAKSETIFDDSRFLLWIDFLASDNDGLTSHSYNLILDKMLKALNYDDSEIVKRLLAGNADIGPDTVAAHVMGALYKYWDSRMEEPVALLMRLVPYIDDDNFLDGPIRIWLRYTDQDLGDAMFTTLLDTLVPPKGEKKPPEVVKSQLKGVKILDVVQPLPSYYVIDDDMKQPLLAVRSQPGGVKTQYENNGLWHPYDQKQSLFDRYEPLPCDAALPSDIHITPPVVSAEPNLPQRNVDREGILVDILANGWMADKPLYLLDARGLMPIVSEYHYQPPHAHKELEDIIVAGGKADDPKLTSKLIRIEKIFEALCRRWDQYAVSPDDMLKFLRISDATHTNLLTSCHLRTWMTYMSNTNRLSSMCDTLTSKLNDKELLFLVGAAMDWNKTFRLPWFRPLFVRWKRRNMFSTVFHKDILSVPGIRRYHMNPDLIVFYHYVTLAGYDRVEQILVVRAIMEQNSECNDETIFRAYESSDGVLKRVYFELLAIPWFNQGVKTNSILKHNKELKSYYNLMRIHPSMVGAEGKMRTVIVPEEYKL